mgnify:FL=1
MDITITVKPTATLTDQQVLTLFVRQRGWVQANPLTKQQFAKRILADIIKQDVKEARHRDAVDAIVIPEEDTAE